MRLLPILAATSGLLMASVLAVEPARAELPPHVYQQARDAAGTVLTLRVQSVRRLPAGETQGTCSLTGIVTGVERGMAQQGQTVVIAVPCISPAWQPMPGPFPGYRHDVLGRTENVRVYMTGGVLARRGLDILD